MQKTAPCTWTSLTMKPVSSYLQAAYSSQAAYLSRSGDAGDVEAAGQAMKLTDRCVQDQLPRL